MSDVGSSKAPVGYRDSFSGQTATQTDRRAVDKTLVDFSKDAYGVISSFVPSFSAVAKIAVSVTFWGGRGINEESRVINHDANRRGPGTERSVPVADQQRVALQKDTVANMGEATFDLAKDLVDALPLAPGVKHAVALADVVVESGKIGKAGADTVKKRSEYRKARRDHAQSGKPMTPEQRKELKAKKTEYLMSQANLKNQAFDSGLNIVKDLAKLTPHSTIADATALTIKFGQMAYQNYDPNVGLPKPMDPWQ